MINKTNLVHILTLALLFAFASSLAAQAPMTNSKKAALARKYVDEASALLDRATPESSRAALGKVSEASRLYKEIDDKQGQAVCLLAEGRIRGELGEKTLALKSYEEGLLLVKDDTTRGYLLNNAGVIYSDLGDNKTAIQYYLKALPFSGKDIKSSLLHQIGMSYHDLGDPQNALEYYNRASPLGDDQDKARTLTSIGIIYFDRGEYAIALDHFFRALKKCEPANRPAILDNIGLVYSRLGNNDKALDYLEQARKLELFENESKARTLNNIASVYLKLGRAKDALDTFEKARIILASMGAKGMEAKTLNNIGVAYVDMGEIEKAIKSYQGALQLARITGDRSVEATALNNLGARYTEGGDNAEAVRHLEQALFLSRTVNDSSQEASILTNLMDLWNRAKNPGLAVIYGKQAINLHQRLRAGAEKLDPDIRRSYRESIEGRYRYLADLLIAQGRVAEAEEILAMLKEDEVFSYLRRDKSVAKNLRKSTSLNDIEIKALDRYAVLAGEITRIGQEFGDLDKERRSYPDGEFPKQALYDEVKNSLDQATDAFQKFLEELKITFGKNDVRVVAVDSGLKAVLQRLHATRTAIVSTIVGEKRLNIIVTTANTQTAHPVDIGEGDFNTLITEFRQTLTDPTIDPRPASQKLYDILVKPIEGDLNGVNADTIVWSLDGALRYIPPAALWDKEKGYLVERFSSAVITLAGSRTIELPPGDRQKMDALGVGVSKAVDGFLALTAVPDELDCIITDAQGKTVSANPKCQTGVITGRKLLDEKFTLSAFEDALGRYPVIHIASHFSLNPGNDKDSFLLLGGGTQKRYTIENLRNAPLADVDLIVFSACNTATPGGEKANGVEIEGFGAVAQQQGAKAVMATLWAVADDSTRDLMVRFYEFYGKSGLSKTEALRQAQLFMISGKYKPGEISTVRSKVTDMSAGAVARLPFKIDDNAPYAHPYYWSPFILFGNWK